MGKFITQFRQNQLIHYYAADKKEYVDNLTAQRKEGINVQGYKGQVSKKIKKQIEKITYNWALAIEVANEYKEENEREILYFITLTLPAPQRHEDKEITQNILHGFLIWAKQTICMSTYIWKAEKQKNGNIHYHLIIDRKIEPQILRKKWNEKLDKLGYISEYRLERNLFHSKGFRVQKNLLNVANEAKQKEWYKYGKATNWTNPRTVHIEECQDLKTVGKYISKYISKNDDKVQISGKVWGKSNNLTNLRYFEKEIKGTEKRQIEYLELGTEDEIDVNEYVKILTIKNVLSDAVENCVIGRKIRMHYLNMYERMNQNNTKNKTVEKCY